MAVVRKFLFDNDFGEAPQGAVGGARAKGAPAGASSTPAAPPAPPAPIFTEAEMQGACDVARRKGEEAGVVRGRNEAISAFDKQVAATLSSLAQQTAAIAKSVAAEAQAAGKSVDLALAIVRKLHPTLVERQGLAEIESVLGQCLESLKQEPRLVAYVHSARLDALQERLAQLSASTGFEGRVVLIADDAMGESDCRVEWADGGVEREAGRIWRAIEETLNRYIAADGREAK
ncbi:FliH/SctL family protein [Dongia deserti]|uniref:FliH/SctL family protein n=1 Tax=Dongia deserti TaxID=2268030 RepID=UPI000E64865F|nr:FliH/SctL family protein [Dongia deserti]